jgi:hypothetical protein
VVRERTQKGHDRVQERRGLLEEEVMASREEEQARARDPLMLFLAQPKTGEWVDGAQLAEYVVVLS